jgi:pseudouridine-5'-phosphate glycosidase
MEIIKHIIAAIDEAKAKGISGKELTPFLLANLAEKTAGKSVQTNLALLKNNVLIGAQIAKELK